MTLVVWLIGAFFAVCIVLRIAFAKEDKKLAAWQSSRSEAEADIESRRLAYESALADLSAKYGQPDNVILVGGYDIDDAVIAFGQSNVLYINGKAYDFRDIISCSVHDNGPVGSKDDIVYIAHDYVVEVNVADLSAPVIQIEVFDSREDAIQITGLIKAIKHKKSN